MIVDMRLTGLCVLSHAGRCRPKRIEGGSGRFSASVLCLDDSLPLFFVALPEILAAIGYNVRIEAIGTPRQPVAVIDLVGYPLSETLFAMCNRLLLGNAAGDKVGLS